MTHKAEEVGYNPQVILAGRRITITWHACGEIIIKRMLQSNVDVANSSILVLGITFKENCPDIRNSQVVELIHELKSWNTLVKVCDPWADKDEVLLEYGITLTQKNDLNQVDAVIVAVGHDEFRNMPIKEFRKICPGDNAVFGDLKSLFNKEALTNSCFTVFRL